MGLEVFNNYKCDCQMSLFESEEEWKPIKGYENSFSVSNLGRVRSEQRIVGNHTGKFLKKERIMTLQTTPKGYKSVTLGAKENKKNISGPQIGS